MLLKHITVGIDEIVTVEDGWRIVTSKEYGDQFHVLLQGEEVEEWKGIESLRSKTRR